MIAQDETIIQYIPQRPPMVMVDTLLASEKKLTRSALTIQSDNIFVKNGLMTAPGLVENIAQTVAAGAGHAALSNNEPRPFGFIAAINNLKIHKLPPVGTELITEVRVLTQVKSLGVVFGQIRQGSDLVAEGEMKVYIQS